MGFSPNIKTHVLATDVRQTGNSRSQHAHIHRRRDGRVKTNKKKSTSNTQWCSLLLALRHPPPPWRQQVAPCIFTAGAARYGGKKEPLSSSPCWLNDGTAAAQRFQKPEKNMAKTWVTPGGVYGYSNQTLAAPAFKPARVIFTVLLLYCCFSCQENQTLILQ